MPPKVGALIMKTIGSIVGALAFLFGILSVLAAIINIDDETTTAIAQGAIGTAFFVLGVGILVAQRLTEIIDHLAQQNESLKDQAHALNAIASRTTDRRLRRERAEKIEK